MIQEITYIDSIEDSRLQLYRTLKKPLLHCEQGLFIAEGNKVVTLFLSNRNQTVLSVLMTEDWLPEIKAVAEQRHEKIALYIADKAQLQQIVGFNYHQGIMAAGIMPSGITIDEAVKQSAHPRLFVAFESIASAENMGALIRNCAATGVNTIIVGETCADPYLRRSVRNSMGTIFNMNFIRPESLSNTLSLLSSQYGFSVYAAHPRIDSMPVDRVAFSQDSCIVFGSEGDGISTRVLSSCGNSIKIPMAPGIDSFNVACASAIILYEVSRQRLTNGNQDRQV